MRDMKRRVALFLAGFALASFLWSGYLTSDLSKSRSVFFESSHNAPAFESGVALSSGGTQTAFLDSPNSILRNPASSSHVPSEPPSNFPTPPDEIISVSNILSPFEAPSVTTQREEAIPPSPSPSPSLPPSLHILSPSPSQITSPPMEISPLFESPLSVSSVWTALLNPNCSLCPIIITDPKPPLSAPKSYARNKNFMVLPLVNYSQIGLECSLEPKGQTISSVRCCGNTVRPSNTLGASGYCNHTQSRLGSHDDMLDDALRAFQKMMAEINTPWHFIGTTLLSWYTNCEIAGIYYPDEPIQVGVMEEDWGLYKIADAIQTQNSSFKFGTCQHFDGISMQIRIVFKPSLRIRERVVSIHQIMRESYGSWMSYMSTNTAMLFSHYNIVPAVYKEIPIGIPDNIDDYVSQQWGHPHRLCYPTRAIHDSRNKFRTIPRWHGIQDKQLFFPNEHKCNLENGGYHNRMRAIPTPSDTPTEDDTKAKGSPRGRRQ